MQNLRKLFWAAILAGLVAGLVSAVLTEFRLAPLIAAAETYEAAPAADHDHTEAAAPAGATRMLLTGLSTVLATLGFALLLGGVSHLMNVPVTLKNAGFWGAGGFWALHLAPAMILAPELPGMVSAGLTARQTIWVLTALASGSGLLVILKARNWPARIVGAALALAPFYFPVLRPDGQGTVPPELASAFAANSLAEGALVWLVLAFGYALALERGKK